MALRSHEKTVFNSMSSALEWWPSGNMAMYKRNGHAVGNVGKKETGGKPAE